jgi:hypothetical protein
MTIKQSLLNNTNICDDIIGIIESYLVPDEEYWKYKYDFVMYELGTFERTRHLWRIGDLCIGFCII